MGEKGEEWVLAMGVGEGRGEQSKVRKGVVCSGVGGSADQSVRQRRVFGCVWMYRAYCRGVYLSVCGNEAQSVLQRGGLGGVWGGSAERGGERGL